MNTDRFDDVLLSAGTIRARARQGGPLGGASASLVTEVAAGRHHRPAVRRSHWQPAENDEQLYLVIDAPTWSLRRKVGPERERAARLFAAAVNTGARRADASTWWPMMVTAAGS